MWYMLYATPTWHMSQSCRCHTCHAPTVPINTLLVDTTALPKTQHVKVVGKKGHWQAKCCNPSTTIPQAFHHQPWFKSHKKGRDTQAAKAKTEKRPPHKDLFIAAMDCRAIGDVHPREMIIDNISSQWCNEAYMVIKLL